MVRIQYPVRRSRQYLALANVIIRIATSFAVPNVHPATSLAYTIYLYTQMDDLSMKGFNVSFAAENTTSFPSHKTTVGHEDGPYRGIPGTRFSASAMPNPADGDDLLMFYQTQGDDISVFTRDLEGKYWTRDKLPIPYD